jgi:hypothetical protein
MTIQQAENKGKLIGFILVTDEIEVHSIINYLGRKRFAKDRNIEGLFVGDTSKGDYSKVYGFSGSIPYNEKELYKIK